MFKRAEVPPFPKAILFDLDDTLYPYAPSNDAALESVVGAVQERFSLSRDRVAAAFASARSLVKSRVGAVAAQHSRILYFHAMLEELGLGSQVEEALRLEQLFWRRYFAEMTTFPGVTNFLSMIRSYGIPMAIVTDLTAQTQFRKIVLLGIADFFDAVVCSEEAGGEKVDGLPYELARQKLGLEKPDVVWMIGDSDSDIGGAKKHLNAVTLHFCGGSGYLHESTPDLVFSSFGELGEIVDGWLGKFAAGTKTRLGHLRSAS